MTTGQDLKRFISDGIDQAYTGFLNSARANRLIRESEIRVAEKTYSTSRTQKQSDELSPLTLLDQTITVKNNYFRTEPIGITGFTVVGTTATLTTEALHQLAVGDSITISDTQGFTPDINGTYTVLTVLSTTQVTFTVVPVVGTWTDNTGDATHAYMFPNLLHPLAIETTYVENDILYLSTVDTSSAPFVKFSKYTNVRTGTKIRISGALGITGLNGDFYCQQRNRTTYFLYTDEALLIPAVLTGTYQGEGKANIIVSEYATRLHSDRRIAPSSNGDEWTPKFGTDGNTIKLFPVYSVCESVKIDYMQNPVVVIDVLDNAVDLEQFYTFKYLMRIKDECVLNFMIQMRELPQVQAEMANNQANP
jgi:hypothetical protein